MARNMEFEPRVSRLMRATRPGNVVGSSNADNPAMSWWPGIVARLQRPSP